MATLFVQDPVFGQHRVPAGHPERPERIAAIEQALSSQDFAALRRSPSVEASLASLEAVHPESYIDGIRRASERGETIAIDADTVIGPATYSTARHAAGGACLATSEVVENRARSAFVAARPPGHHAEADRAMGFCIFNAAVIAARWAQREHGASRVAIVDWDVHHGNGTQAIVWDDPSILYASTHQMPHYPGTGAASERGAGNIINVPLAAGMGGVEFRARFRDQIMTAVADFSPDLIVISAGFDAHRRDPLGDINLEAGDFAWATDQVMDVADRCCDGRIVSVLEGGYDLDALADSVRVHVAALMSA